MEFLDFYPAISESVSVRVVKSDHIDLFLNNRKVLRGNNDLLRFLREINGRKTVRSILEGLTDSRENYQDAISVAECVLRELLEKKILELKSQVTASSTVRIMTEDESLAYPMPPIMVSLELTSKCNLACTYCYQNSSIRRNDFLSSPLSLLEQLKQLGVEHVELTGGEPLLHPEFEKIAEYAVRNFKTCGLITNGMLLNDRVMDILSTGNSLIQICLDGSTPARVDSISRVPGSFERIVKGIKLVVGRKTLFRVGMVVQNEDQIEDVEPTLLLAKSLGATHFLMNPSIDIGRGPNTLIKDSRLLETLRNVHLEMSRKYAGFYETEQSLEDNVDRYTNCGAGSRRLAVNWSGEIKLCPMQDSSWLNLGNIFSISGKALQRMLSSFESFLAPNSTICSNCENMMYCMNCIIRPLNLLKKGAMIPNECAWYLLNEEVLEESGLTLAEESCGVRPEKWTRS